MKNKNVLVGIAALVAAAVALFVVRKKKANATEKPPKKAPQLPIQNPGSQDNFPTSAVESEIG